MLRNSSLKALGTFCAVLAFTTLISSFCSPVFAASSQPASYYQLDTTYTVVTGNVVATHRRVAVLKSIECPGRLTIVHTYRAGWRMVAFTFEGCQPAAFSPAPYVAIFKGPGADDDDKLSSVVEQLLTVEVTASTKKSRTEFRVQISEPRK